MWEKIVFNLLSNAFKYTHGGSISVRLKQAADDAIEFAVTDTGVGIPSEELTKVFERFHRIQSASGRSQEGTGIGLALVQELAKLHQGKITVQSKAGAGSTFTVTLPIGKAHLPSEQIISGKSSANIAGSTDVFIEEALKWLPSEDNEEVDANETETETLAITRPDKTKAKVLLADD